ncbi:unnamed protein product [Gongylonema pulchrum]|uniref:Ig-like domain-containing protein n=1 Tax=Gongylonema pulchrum TaxID=637853 RepID=A0A3P6P0N9_9BILA|nr:unnamed protein product [Gongylonema pulchrum]
MPTAQQLQNRKSGENVAIICSVIGLQKSLDAEVDIKWFREEQEMPIIRFESLICALLLAMFLHFLSHGRNRASIEVTLLDRRCEK